MKPPSGDRVVPEGFLEEARSKLLSEGRAGGNLAKGGSAGGREEETAGAKVLW